MDLSFYTNWPNYDLSNYSSFFQDPTIIFETEINPIFDTNFPNNQPEFQYQHPFSNYHLPYSSAFDNWNNNFIPVECYNTMMVAPGAWNDYKVKKKENVGLSGQSMAARVRRRKISEKTAELGKLIPGGYKMNTAEMFQAAYKYIKFLQAQIGVLQFMAAIPDYEQVLGNGEMQALVTCKLMQQKLYIAEKCIGPQNVAPA